MWKKVLKVAAVPVALSAFLVGCSNGKDAAIATVNKEEILESELVADLKQQYGSEVLDSLITSKIVELEAKKEKIKVDKDAIEAEYQEYIDSYGSEDELLEAVKSYGMDKEAVKDDIENYLLTVQVMEKYLDLKDEDAKAYFEENKSKYDTAEQVEASHILVEDEATANELYNKIKEGEDFAALAKENSTDAGTAENGGALGLFGKGEMDEAFEKAAFGAKVGDVTKPVKTEYGYHIIKVTDKTEEKKAKFEDVKEKVQEDLLNAKVEESYNTWLDEMYEKYEIKSKLFTDSSTEEK